MKGYILNRYDTCHGCFVDLRFYRPLEGVICPFVLLIYGRSCTIYSLLHVCDTVTITVTITFVLPRHIDIFLAVIYDVLIGKTEDSCASISLVCNYPLQKDAGSNNCRSFSIL